MTQAIVLDAAPVIAMQAPETAAPEGDGSFAFDLEAALSETPVEGALQAILENPQGAAQAAAEVLSILQDGAAPSAELLVALENIAAGYVPADVEDTFELLTDALEITGLEQLEMVAPIAVAQVPTGQVQEPSPASEQEAGAGTGQPDAVQAQAEAGVPEFQLPVSPETPAPPVSEAPIAEEAASAQVGYTGEQPPGEPFVEATQSTQSMPAEPVAMEAAQAVPVEEQAAVTQVVPADEVIEVQTAAVEHAAQASTAESAPALEQSAQARAQSESVVAEPTGEAGQATEPAPEIDYVQVGRGDVAEENAAPTGAQSVADTAVASAVAAGPVVFEEMTAFVKDVEQTGGEVAAQPVDESLGAMQGAQSAAARTESLEAPESASSGVDQERIISRIANTISQASEGERQTVRLRLFPPELGTVRVEVSSVRGTLSVRIETSTAEAQSAIHSNVAALERQLSDGGLETRNIDVEYRDPSSHFGAWRQPGQDGRYRETTHQQNRRSDMADEDPSEESPRAALATAGSINVLL